jgi:hypothetical protein
VNRRLEDRGSALRSCDPNNQLDEARHTFAPVHKQLVRRRRGGHVGVDRKLHGLQAWSCNNPAQDGGVKDTSSSYSTAWLVEV